MVSTGRLIVKVAALVIAIVLFLIFLFLNMGLI
jgi:hypothetical protein